MALFDSNHKMTPIYDIIYVVESHSLSHEDDDSSSLFSSYRKFVKQASNFLPSESSVSSLTTGQISLDCCHYGLLLKMYMMQMTIMIK